MKAAYVKRRIHDLRKLETLSKSSGGKIRIVSTAGNPVHEIEIELTYKTAPNKAYPDAISQKTTCVITLPSQYPKQEPKAVIKTSVFHPNVYESGNICMGVKWLQTEGIDLFVKRIAQIITFDPAILNESSPANRNALSWYYKARSKHPAAFPTDSALFSTTETKKNIAWSDLSK